QGTNMQDTSYSKDQQASPQTWPFPVPHPAGAAPTPGGISGTGMGPQLNFGQHKIHVGISRPKGPYQCPRPIAGAMCGGTSYRCNRDNQCETGAKCCPDACGVICMKAVPAPESAPSANTGAPVFDVPAMPGSLLVATCIDNNCARPDMFGNKQPTHSECDAIRACRAGYVCCFNGCRNICRSTSQPQGGMFGNLFGGGSGGMDMNTMMLLMAAGGS
ncbi:hypothetical protein BaRGS_00038742, partial [Batillaria attramentaria]